MKKALILTGSTGAGHNQAAKSLEEKFIKYNYEVVKMDLFKETSKYTDIAISDGYRVLASKFPGLYGIIYDVFDTKSLNSRVLRVGLIKVRKKLLKQIEEFEPDIVVGTHPFAVGLISDLKAKQKINSKFISVITDFKAHYAYISPNVDAYITGSEYTKQSLVQRGIDEKIIFPFGIPVKEEFQNSKDRVRKSFSKEGFKVLIMGGSMGSKDIGKVVKQLINQNLGYKLIVVCGNNKVLKSTLDRKYKEYVNSGILEIKGFTKNVSALMDECDCIITKPGGLTTTESLQKRIPMVIPFAIPGQETENTNFLTDVGAAISVDSVEEIAIQLEKLTKDKKFYIDIVNNMENISKEYSVDKIVNLSDELIIENEIFI